MSIERELEYFEKKNKKIHVLYINLNHGISKQVAEVVHEAMLLARGCHHHIISHLFPK
jgi:hypothetical protein